MLLEEIERRQLDMFTLRQVLAAPEERYEVRPGRIVLQKLVYAADIEKQVLYRVFLDIDRHPPSVVTAYRTTKIGKYRRISA